VDEHRRIGRRFGAGLDVRAGHRRLEGALVQERGQERVAEVCVLDLALVQAEPLFALDVEDVQAIGPDQVRRDEGQVRGRAALAHDGGRQLDMLGSRAPILDKG